MLPVMEGAASQCDGLGNRCGHEKRGCYSRHQDGRSALLVCIEQEGSGTHGDWHEMGWLRGRKGLRGSLSCIALFMLIRIDLDGWFAREHGFVFDGPPP